VPGVAGKTPGFLAIRFTRRHAWQPQRERNRSTSTTTRIILPTATRPCSSDAETVLVRRRDREREAPSVDLGEHCLGHHLGGDAAVGSCSYPWTVATKPLAAVSLQ
jgi:hypothetical protein